MRVRRGRFFDFYLATARLWLLVERLWPALWPATAIVGLFTAFALFEIHTVIPGWLHAVVLLAALLGLIAAIRRAIISLPAIDDDQARHRIELDSGLSHRPLTALEDKLATGDSDSQAVALWAAHHRRMIDAVRRLALRLPAAGLARIDPWGLRAALLLVLVIGAIAAGRDSLVRIGDALVPRVTAGNLNPGAGLDIWVTPPAYTGIAPIFLQTSARVSDAKPTEIGPKGLKVPEDSTVLAQVSGGGAQPILMIDDEATEFARVDADAYHIEKKLTGGSRLAVKQRGREIAAWPLTVIPDALPSVTFSSHPEGTPQLRMSFAFDASDDYGLTAVRASIRRADGEEMPAGGDEIVIDLPLPGRDRINIKGKSDHDLTSHIWAGLPVLIHLQAVDGRGNTGVSKLLPAVLPERRFHHPVAREVVELRKRLKSDMRSRRLAALKLDGITQERKRFGDDKTVFLALRVARSRLIHDTTPDAVTAVQKILWDTALRIEEGLAAVAGRELEDAQRALQEALQRNASPEELERLMDEVQRALDRFMSALLQELENRGQQVPLDRNAEFLGSDDLQRLLDRARELMRQGSRDAARQLLADLQRMLQGLRGSLSRGRVDRGMRQAQRAMGELRDIIRKQQKLLDESFRQSQRDEESETKEQADRQEALRKQLGKLMQKFSEMTGRVPKGLGDAERQMRDAEAALGKGRPGQAVGPQTKALEALRQGAQNSARQLARRFGRGRQFGIGRGFGRGFGPRRGELLRGLRPGNRDPFGRPAEEGGTGSATGSVKIPGEADIQRSREILEELRRRAGDLWRPEYERQYIDRLLERF